MINLVAPEELTRKPGKSEGVFQVDYIGNSHKNQRGPQAFLVELEKPGHVIKPHFHHVDQFQIVVDGGGRLGKHELYPVTVHYTDSFTPYGPIVAGDDGLKFFNFRPCADVGAEYMPGARERLLRHAGRNLVAETTAAKPSEAVGLTVTPMIEQHPDGLEVTDILAGPNESLPNGVAGGGGRYELVLTGSVTVEGSVYKRWACVFTSAGSELPPRVAGPEGAHVLVAQAPSP
jgi:hypothetical protein